MLFSGIGGLLSSFGERTKLIPKEQWSEKAAHLYFQRGACVTGQGCLDRLTFLGTKPSDSTTLGPVLQTGAVYISRDISYFP